MKQEKRDIGKMKQDRNGEALEISVGLRILITINGMKKLI